MLFREKIFVLSCFDNIVFSAGLHYTDKVEIIHLYVNLCHCYISVVNSVVNLSALSPPASHSGGSSLSRRWCRYLQPSGWFPDLQLWCTAGKQSGPNPACRTCQWPPAAGSLALDRQCVHMCSWRKHAKMPWFLQQIIVKGKKYMFPLLPFLLNVASHSSFICPKSLHFPSLSFLLCVSIPPSTFPLLLFTSFL